MADLQAQLAALRDQLAKLESLRDLLGDELTGQKKAVLEDRIRVLVESGGGAVVGGDVDTEGGDFVGRDKWQVILGDQYVGLAPDQVPPDVLLQAYLRSLAAECSRLPLGVVDPRFVDARAETPVPLSEVYVDLDVLASVRGEEKVEGRPLMVRLARGEGGERMPLLEAIAHPQVTRFVLLGDPGSGKTTFVHYLAYALASGVCLDAPLQGMLPVRLVLREVAARCIPPDSRRGRAGMLWEALRIDLNARLGMAAAAVLFPHWQRRLLKEGGLIMLDGLDEVPEAARRRKCLLEAVADLAAALPAGSRVLVTARPYAYAEPRWHLSGFHTLLLAPFDERQVGRFVDRWYQAVRPAMGWDEAAARGRGERLAQVLAERPYLADLSTRPLLLTLMATLHTSWGQLPGDRANLYEETVRLLLSRWQRGREVKGADGETVVEPGIARALQVEEGVVRTALHRLAYAVHARQGAGATREAAAADISEGEVLAAFAPLLPEDVNPRLLLRYLETRAGLLVGRAPGIYAFLHRSFQEYLAACHLADGAEFAQALRRHVRQDLDWWRQAFLLGVGKARQGGLGAATHVVHALVPEGPQEVPARTDAHWRVAALAGEALVDLRFPGVAQGKPDFEALLRRVRRWLVDLLETPGALTPRERAGAGDTLGALGDPRPGVGVVLSSFAAPEGRQKGEGFSPLPDILWCEVPGEPFLMGSAEEDEGAYDYERAQHTLDLATFLVGRYPIANAQYRGFVEDGGYEEPAYWTAEGWAWRTGEREADLSAIEDKDLRNIYANHLARRPVGTRDRPFWWDHPRLGLPTRPVVGVTWYEALAYCRWLEKKLKVEGCRLKVWRDGQLATWNLEPGTFAVRLPGEAEWEKAARGDDGRRWPWGDTWAEGRANTKEAGIGETCAVGAFPAGASLCGALDMAGNVWEWTRSRWGRTSILRPDYGYPYDPADGREDLEGPDLRVVRGGSWVFPSGLARCTSRSRVIPDLWVGYVGLRVVVSLARPPEF